MTPSYLDVIYNRVVRQGKPRKSGKGAYLDRGLIGLDLTYRLELLHAVTGFHKPLNNTALSNPLGSLAS
jgi:hypothetical protein